MGRTPTASETSPTAVAAPPRLPLGVVVHDDGLAADALLSGAARTLLAEGRRLAGLVQTNRSRPGRSKCDMSLTELASGAEIAISQDLGQAAGTCSLDPEAFARAAHLAERGLAAGADLLIINKFGKQEAQGRGLRDVIASALLQGTPVLLSVSRANLGSLLAFTGGEIEPLPAEAAAILDWARGVQAGGRGPRTAAPNGTCR